MPTNSASAGQCDHAIVRYPVARRDVLSHTFSTRSALDGNASVAHRATDLKDKMSTGQTESIGDPSTASGASPKTNECLSLGTKKYFLPSTTGPFLSAVRRLRIRRERPGARTQRSQKSSMTD